MRGVIAWEVTFPLVFVLPTPGAVAYLAVGVAFHVGCALVLGSTASCGRSMAVMRRCGRSPWAGDASAGCPTAKSILLGKHLVIRNGESRAELGRHMHEPARRCLGNRGFVDQCVRLEIESLHARRERDVGRHLHDQIGFVETLRR